MASGDPDPLAAYVRAQVEAVFDEGGRLPDPQAVHQTRVAIRRLRSTLRVFEPLLSLEPAELARADEELRWFAALLGEARDRHVQRERFAAVLDALPAEDVIGPVPARLEEALRAEQVEAEGEIARAVASERCADLRHMLGRWRHRPPVADVGARALRKRARKAATKADRRLATASHGAGADLHPARKAAKRARYAGEVLAPLGRGKKQRKRHKLVQVLLGDYQDAIVAQETLRRLAGALGPSESGFTLGVLHERERETARGLSKKARQLARKRR
ncbi:hypothetical protein JCM18899A_19310 [Nocardioides sp. AN3]